MGRLKFKPTDEHRSIVKALAAVGIQQEYIAKRVGIRSVKTLRLHFRDELDSAEMEANATVAGAVYKSATGGNVMAMDLWLRNRAGWGSTRSNPVQVQPPPFVVAREETPKHEPQKSDLELQEECNKEGNNDE